jgi:probable selenium-dependent hydroxylase accessory protein YqeC
MMIAIVGAGGKTTVLYHLGHRLAAMGRRVLLTTTTKICRPGDITLYLGPPDKLRPDAALMAAASGMVDTCKLAGYSARDIGVITSLGLFDDILVEADGAARKPIKSPNEAEPVYPQPVDLVIGVIGLDSLGQPATDETVHRLPLFTRVTGASSGEPVTAAHVLALIGHAQGLFRHAPAGVPRVVFLNKCDTIDEDARRQAEEIVRRSPYPTLLTGHDMNWAKEFFRRFMPNLHQQSKGE